MVIRAAIYLGSGVKICSRFVDKGSSDMKEANSKFGSKGFTLIEMIIFIIIAGIFIPLTFVAFSGALKESMTPEKITEYRLAAEKVIELTAKQIPTLTNNFTADSITAPTTCSGIPGCSVIPEYITFNGSAFGPSPGSHTNYVLITVNVNGFITHTLVTKHEYP